MIHVSILSSTNNSLSLIVDTNNLLTQLYSNKEVLEKVVVIKSDAFTW
jgi:hypothetical protein